MDGIFFDFFGCGAFFLCEGVRSFVSRFFRSGKKVWRWTAGKRRFLIEVDRRNASGDREKRATVRGPEPRPARLVDGRASGRGYARDIASARTGEENLDQADDLAHALIPFLGGHHLRRVALDAVRHRAATRVRVVAGPARGSRRSRGSAFERQRREEPRGRDIVHGRGHRGSCREDSKPPRIDRESRSARACAGTRPLARPLAMREDR